jgi:arginine deiminase
MSLQVSGQYYHEVLKRIPPRDLPAFEDEAMQERVWGRRWGVYNDVGPLRTVLVHRPGDEIRIMTADRYDPSIEALIDDEAQWYWRGDRAPDLAVMQKEHDALAGHALHIDGQLVMVDEDLALINIERTPYWFLDTLRDLKIRWVEVHHADNPRVLNCLAVRPGKVLLAINNGDGTAERLVDHGVEVVPLQYAECQRNGGGIHCSTLPLVRDRS